MSRLMMSSCLVLSFAAFAGEPAKAPTTTTVPVPKNAAIPAQPTMPTGAELNKVLYAFGVMLAQRTPVGQAGLTETELKEVLKGLQDAALGKTLAVKMDEYGPKIDTFLSLKRDERGKVEKKKGEDALAKFAKEPGAQKQPSGLIYFETKAGTGPNPAPADTVKVHYKGTLIDGSEFDSSYSRGEPTEFPLNGVIKCWTEGVAKMKVGGKAKLVCPSDIAYGPNGAGGKIGPNATLIFEVELLAIKPAAAPAPAK